MTSTEPIRAADAHKGDAGRVVVCAGSPDFTGAAAMCANAAVKAGAGLVSLLTPLSSRDVLALKLTEVMVHGLLERSPGVLGSAAASDVLTRANKADVLAIGPGLGLSDSTQEAVRDILSKCEVPVVIDADAITALKDNTEVLTQMTAPKVLTPHAGEMSRLTGLSVEEINRNRINVAHKYAQEWQAVVVLKGAPTVVPMAHCTSIALVPALWLRVVAVTCSPALLRDLRLRVFPWLRQQYAVCICMEQPVAWPARMWA